MCITSTLLGCSVASTKREKIRDLEYTVVSQEEIPKEVIALIEQHKQNHMKLSYVDKGYMYVIVGYGEQKTSGYSIRVETFYETENTLDIDTNLIGPSKEEEVVQTRTYPYIVLKLEEVDKPIVYN